MNEQSGGTVTVSTETEPKGLSWRGIAEVFYSPVAFFEKLAQHPKVLVPYVVFGLLIAVYFTLIADFIVEIQMPKIMESLEAQGQTMTPQLMTIIKWQTVIMGSIVWMLYPIVMSALALFVGNFVFAGRAKYRQLLSVALYGAILYTIGLYVILPMVFAKGSILVSLSPAVFIQNPEFTDGLFLSLSKFGVFNIWEIIVVGIGLTAVYRFSRNKGYLLAVISIGLLSIIQVVTTVLTR